MSTGKTAELDLEDQRAESVSEPVTVPEAGAGPVPTEPQSALYLFASWTLWLKPTFPPH